MHKIPKDRKKAAAAIKAPYGRKILGFYTISLLFYKWIFLRKGSQIYLNKLRERLTILYPEEDSEKLVREFLCYKIMYTCIILFIGSILALTFGIQKGDETKEIRSISRNGYWEGARIEELQISVDGVMEEESMEFEVEERAYAEEELESVLEENANRLDKLILAENESLDYVTSDLNLVSRIPGTDIEVFWETDHEEILSYDGKLQEEHINEEGVVIGLSATLSYQKETLHYQLSVHVFLPQRSAEEAVKQKICQMIETKEAESASADAFALPEELDGKKISYQRKVDTYGKEIIILLLISVVAVFFLQDERLAKQMEVRNRQLLLDYPDLVSKITLLLGAGMTIRSSMEKIAFDYDEKKENGKHKRKAVYEELLFICRKMQGGMSEYAGLESFGKRCGLPCYMKFSTLLQQNLRKGSRGLVEMLESEVTQAFQKRKNIAKKAGEEAGTKLLGPMLFMLLIVLVILILPACLAFQI